MKRIQKRLVVFVLFALMLSITPILAFAEDEEGERDSEFEEREQAENEREEEGYDSSTFSGMILYVTIVTIFAAIGYTVFKITRSKKKTPKQD